MTKPEPGKIQRIITKDCGHTDRFVSPYPKLGESIYCYKCNRDVIVTHAPNEWRVSCMDCKYSKPFGDARINAEIAAGKHRSRRFHHRVRLLNGTKLIRTFENRDQTVIF